MTTEDTALLRKYYQRVVQAKISAEADQLSKLRTGVPRFSPDLTPSLGGSGRTSQVSEDAIRRSAYYDFIQQHVAGMSGFTHAHRPSLFQNPAAASQRTTVGMALQGKPIAGMVVRGQVVHPIAGRSTHATPV
jgi:hypothetical protein